ncbi:MAG: Rieske 2Fe-2S domain-containing protein [Rhodospirillaceae bacterium]|jgi:phthalate 4,5-dioxygenase|nr:Rieske 2Fe-2S domain-containing protein [Rhodospirillaceae bacterium]MBT5457297.1 Rieske 2Fe-2S domain-containing protein [Rhodospirillaceae bacterium]
MLSQEENERVTRVGPGTPMGETLRRYWMPALLAWELPEPDCPPVRIKLLGEELVAFRATDGSLGLLQEFCPHRRASLWLGRNEENGLRCVYHGWKFDVTGQCVEQMNEPEPFCEKIRATAYPTVESGGVIWAYMGPVDKRPPDPGFEWTRMPDGHCSVSRVREECNWLQALEGGIDTSHFTIMHRVLNSNSSGPGIQVDTPAVRGGPPTLDVDVTDYGYAYFGIRPLGDSNYARGYHYVMPFTQMRPPDSDDSQVHGHFWVPMDDENCMAWNFYYSYGDEPMGDQTDRLRKGGNAYGSHVDIENGFRSIANRSNDWMIDRQAQKTDTFTGVDGINLQDRAVQESMGRIVDRSQEHLGPADKAIIAARKLLLEAVDVVEAGGDPRGTDASYHEVRAIERVLPGDADWKSVLRPLMYPQSIGGQ